ncbi:hypothetical protein IAD21_05766 [Abditibacteriota bacterium]|nr:hypothetical protein IAD21_05766 [Abditibacteriota bacterium]
MKNFNAKQIGLLALTLGTMAGAASAQDGVRVRINGAPFRTQVAPVTENGRVLVPMRAIFEKLGARVDYNNLDRSIVARRDGTVVRMTLGRDRAFVDRDPVRLDVPAQSYDGRTMVPLRFVSEALGANVDYDSYRQLVSIEDRGGSRDTDRLPDRPRHDGDRPLRDRDSDGVPNDRDRFPDNSNR